MERDVQTRSWRACGALMAAVLWLAAAAVPAGALALRDLTGWWIAIDDTFPNLWTRSGIAAMEASRFWKLRNAWFRVKGALGIGPEARERQG